MGNVRKLLKQLEVQEAKRKRKCHGNGKHAITAGQRCLVIENQDFPGGKNYCVRCADSILDQAEADVWQQRNELFRFSNGSWRAYVLEKERDRSAQIEMNPDLMSPQSTSMGRAPMESSRQVSLDLESLSESEETLEEPATYLATVHSSGE